MCQGGGIYLISDAAKSWLDQLRAQALSLKGFVTKGETFHAFRSR